MGETRRKQPKLVQDYHREAEERVNAAELARLERAVIEAAKGFRKSRLILNPVDRIVADAELVSVVDALIEFESQQEK